jgi:cobalt-precorrin 5A hydrolase/precorrin-3B C17-methyltransferase
MMLNLNPPGRGFRAATQAALTLIGIGPGDLNQLTAAAIAALASAEVVIGYQVYIDLVKPLLSSDQELIASPIGSEMERAGQAIDLAEAGRSVALISSGDVGLYGMASPVFDLLHERGWQGDDPEVMVLPGISAIQAAGARLGAPLGHDVCTISLSDLLTPWSLIERRIEAAAWGDFVITFYNPRSQKRDWQLKQAVDILLTHRPASTPAAIVRNVTRPDESITITTLADLDPDQADMFTLVLVGNSQSYVFNHHIVTPRGYVTTSPASSDPTNLTRSRSQIPDPKSQIPNPRSQIPNPKSQIPNPTPVYPITLTDLANTPAIVIGGGRVGERKVRGLLDAGVPVRLISPEATSQLQAWAGAERLEWQRRVYQSGDLTGTKLVIAATNQRNVNAQVAQEAHGMGLLCNIADQPAEGNFHVPAVHRRPDLVIAVSTAGQSPTRARQIRDRIAAWLDEEASLS